MRDPNQLNLPTGQGQKLAGLRRAAIIFLAATVLGFFFAAQMYFSAVSMHHEISWGQALYWSFGDWYEWALLSPIIFWVLMRGKWRLDKRRADTRQAAEDWRKRDFGT